MLIIGLIFKFCSYCLIMWFIEFGDGKDVYDVIVVI